MIPLAAYADRLSVRPGETIRFHVANDTGVPVDARIERVVCADANPQGPGIVTEPVSDAVVQLREPAPQSVPRGGHIRTEALPAEALEGSFSVVMRVFPTLLVPGDQCLLSCMDLGAGGGFGFGLDQRGHLFVQIGSNAGTTQRLRMKKPLAMNQWSLAWMSVDRESCRLKVGYAALAGGLRPVGDAYVEEAALSLSPDLPVSPIMIAALHADEPECHYNGRLEAPALLDGVVTPPAVAELVAGRWPARVIAHWDFSQRMSGTRVVDTGPLALHGRTVNSPVRAVRGSLWDGSEMCWRHAPAHYGAIHFHDDDIDDCCWPVCYEWRVPEDTRSRAYALFLQAGDAVDNVPFFVVAPKMEHGAGRRADVAVLVSTFTYTVYGNHLRHEWRADPVWREAWLAQTREWGGYPHNPGEHPEYGLSTYNDHSDRSGISIASWHRPMFNVRVGYLTYPYPELRASGLRHLPADSHLLAWLERHDVDFDLVSDMELHSEGATALEGYSTLLTGSHPEYHTRQTLDALTAYRDGGGRFCYLGGNGFYWKVAMSPERDGVIEIRRAEGGIRAWAAEPGEYYNQFDGEYGGLWRRNGRAPQRLAGVGFTAQGNFLGSYYRRTGTASDPRVAWMFDGVQADILGDHGLSGHGAAGFELDRADTRLGTPEHALVVARSENHPPDAPWVLVPEEALTHITTWPGEPAAELIRADMTFFETPAGGAVFSTGSITFCGSLLTDGDNVDVSRLLLNVINRFRDPTPFDMP
jgi:N,N-dimethylformamidase